MRSLSFDFFRYMDRGFAFVAKTCGKVIILAAFVVASPVLVPIVLLGWFLIWRDSRNSTVV